MKSNAALAEVCRSARAVARTVAFCLKVLPMLPSQPIDWATKRPVVERVTYPTDRGPVEGDLYRAPGTERIPGIVVCLGVVPFGVDHPQVARLGEALARAGFAALLYWSPAMRDLRLDAGDAVNFARAYGWLVEQPYIDPARSGLLGTCVGGAFALIAASDPLIRDRVVFVAAFAPYSSMWTFARDIASATRMDGDARVPWQVDQLTRNVFIRSVTDGLTPDEQARVRAAVEDPTQALAPDGLSGDGAAVYRLLTAGDFDETVLALEALPAALRQRLDALSPLPAATEITAPMIVFAHDRSDLVIPVSQSRQLQRALTGRAGVHYTEFDLFQHATPRSLPVFRLARELVRFFRYTYPLFRVSVG
ncbi:MAG: hypothetical protein Q8M79_08450 [Dehalococcoidia bacterium]|nr:hypothetical protein [Dehalococcoidia bacterium]